MTDPDKQARLRDTWRDVGEEFSALGKLTKDRYRTAGDDDANLDDGDDDGEGERASAALKAALDKLVAAGRELGERVGDVARDDEVRSHAKRTSSSLDDALSATVDLIEEQMAGLFKRTQGQQDSKDAPAADSPGWDPPSPPTS